LDDDKIRAIIHKRYSPDKAGEAMDYLSKGSAPGKVIINFQETNN
jgi:hypothetical protein